MGHGTVTMIYLGTALRSVGWCQQNHTKEVESRSSSSEKNTLTCGQRNQSTQKQVSWGTSEEPKLDRDMWQKWNVLEKMCRMETSFLISLTLLSNNNDWPPRKFLHQLQVILKHNPHYQYTMDQTTKSWSERERHTHTTNSETRIERKWERKRKNPEESKCYFRVSEQTLDLIHWQSKLNWISHASAQGAVLSKGERQRKNYGERESEKNWDQNDRDTGRKKEEETESTMWHVLHT